MKNQKLTVYFVGGSSRDFLIPQAEAVAAEFKQKDWVKVLNAEINTKNIAYYTVTEISVGGPPKIEEDEDEDELESDSSSKTFWNN